MMIYRGEGEWGLRARLGEEEVLKRYMVRSNKRDEPSNHHIHATFQWLKNTT